MITRVNNLRDSGRGVARQKYGTLSPSPSYPSGLLSLPLLLICYAVGMIENAPTIPFFACILFGIGMLVFSLDRQDLYDRSFLHALFARGFLLRLGYAVFLYYLLIYTRGEPFLGGGDDRQYEATGEIIYNYWQAGVFETNMNQPAYPVFIAFLRYCCDMLGGYHGFVTRLANAFVGALIAPFLFILVRNVYDRSIAKTASLVVMLYPDFILYSSVQLRDIIIVFLFVFALSQLSRYIISGVFSGILLSFAAVPPMLYLRNAYGYLLFGILSICLGACVIFQGGKSTHQQWLKTATVFASVLLLSVYVKDAAIQYSGNIDNGSGILRPMQEDYATDMIMRYRGHNTSAASFSSVGAYLLTRLPFVLSLFVLPVVAFIMPYPPPFMLVQLGPIGIIYFINSTTWTILMPLGILGLFSCWKKSFPHNLMLILPMLLLLFISSSGGFDNRYKLASIPFSLVFVAVGLYEVFLRKHESFVFSYWFIQAGLFGAYLAAKILIARG